MELDRLRDIFKTAKLALDYNLKYCECDSDTGNTPCRMCAIHQALIEAEKLLNKKITPGKWETGIPSIFFTPTHAVYQKGSESSLCYTTSEERAQWIASKLNALAN